LSAANARPCTSSFIGICSVHDRGESIMHRHHSAAYDCVDSPRRQLSQSAKPADGARTLADFLDG
jgi:hypothetical protein